jgi:general secretion pathway protein M
MMEWWLSKTQREQLMLITAGAAMLVFLLYLLAWQPFTEAIEQNHQRVISKQATLQWMEENLGEVQRLRRQQNSGGAAATNEALLTLVDRTSKQNQLRQQIQRIKPQGENSVQLWVEQAPFDTLMKWLGELSERYGILIDTLNIDRQNDPGVVNARLVLQRAGGA